MLFLIEIRDQTVLVLINKLLKQKGKGSQQEVFTILPVSVCSLSCWQLHLPKAHKGLMHTCFVVYCPKYIEVPVTSPFAIGIV